MICPSCETQPHAEADCEYPVSCSCQHKMRERSEPDTQRSVAE